MNFSPFPKSPYLLWLLLFTTLFSLSLSLSDPRISEAALFCGNTSSPTPQPRNNAGGYIPNFVKAMEALSQLVAADHWGRFVVNSTTSTTPVFGLAQCHRDLSPTDCLLCFAVSRTRIPHCLPSVSARIYLDGCFLRDESFDFFGESVDPVRDTVNCSSSSDGAKKLGYEKSVGELFDNLTKSAVVNGGFAVGEVEGVFGLAQCWKTVSSDGCRDCLEKAANGVRGCVPSKEGRGLNAGCYLRYSNRKFFDDGAGTLQQNSGASATGGIVTIALAAAAFSLLSFFAGYACIVRLSRLKQERNNLSQVSSLFNKSCLNFKYEALEKATNYFDPSRKIGQGGAGAVFKGTLLNGETVAVKRLFFNTRQWAEEFFNEVNLISGIQHKNLVRLLGCSIEGPESLLVYEYVPNKCLNHFLFGKDKVQSLNWKQRVDIIVGTAEGLAYLHGGSKTRIIHRDIKSSNVLLDENLAPKIADFGLARCFGADETHVSTGIAGTLGYMAPEYIVRGQLTEKADVYSFGVLVIEIVCGRKNNSFIEDSSSLIHTVWKLYNTTNTLADAVDPRLRDDFPLKEVSHVLQIGLLCTQASVALRPSMTEVVQMLTDRDCEIPEPNQPPFLNARALLNPAGSDRLFGLNSLITKALAKIKSPYTSTESSIVLSSDEASTS